MISSQLTPSHRRIAVVCGGTSAEREISLRSGIAIIESLRKAGHLVAAIDPLYQDLDSYPWCDFELAFLALHGTGGEDGSIQEFFEDRQITFTGCGSVVSQMAFDKVIAKQEFVSAGLQTPRWSNVDLSKSHSQMIEMANSLGYPLVVKPTGQGSSLGVSFVRCAEELSFGIKHASRFSKEIFFEAAVVGEEWTVATLDQQVLPPIRIRTPHSFYDFTAKYSEASTTYELVDPESDPVAQAVVELARRAVQQLGCRGVCRTDLRVDQNGQPWLLETNTIPGMTSQSLVPKAARAIGWNMTELCERIINSAMTHAAPAGASQFHAGESGEQVA